MTRIVTRRFGLLALLLPLGLGGCGAPVAFQVASLAVDGVSYLATGKSLFDHGLSAVAEEDCAMLRVVTEGQICRDGETALVEAKPEAAMPEEAPAPEAGPAQPVEVAELPPPPAFEAPAPAAVPPEPAGAPVPVTEDARYLVIASVPNPDGAQRLADRHAELKASVLPAEVKGRTTYRVVVGPVSLGDVAMVEDRLEAAGIKDSWRLRAPARPASHRPAMLAALQS
jgi:hypothetical protein